MHLVARGDTSSSFESFWGPPSAWRLVRECVSERGVCVSTSPEGGSALSRSAARSSRARRPRASGKSPCLVIVIVFGIVIVIVKGIVIRIVMVVMLYW